MLGTRGIVLYCRSDIIWISDGIWILTYCFQTNMRSNLSDRDHDPFFSQFLSVNSEAMPPKPVADEQEVNRHDSAPSHAVSHRVVTQTHRNEGGAMSTVPCILRRT
jgi:hypothetical protein